jgi:UDP-2-acetamido-3-amino-2,3-dideoxy-glucuronate N-acetyltransferase
MMTPLSVLTPSDLAPNLLVGLGVRIADDVEIGANVVLHDGVSVGPGARLDDGAVLGRVPRLGRRSRTQPAAAGPTVVETAAVICPYAVVDAGAWVGPHAFVGDRVSLRAGVRVHLDASIGGATFVGHGADIGERVRTQNNCVIGPDVVIEPGAFLGPGVQVLTGRTMSGSPRRPPPVLRRGCQVGAGALIMPGVEIGVEAIVGAGAVVLDDIPDSTVVAGVPARVASSAAADIPLGR